MKMVNARRSDRGFSLLEAMVALVILSVVLLGLQAGLGTAISMNTENLLRQEAANVAHERMERYRMTSPPDEETVSRQVRDFNVTYTLENEHDSITGVVETTVTWNYQGKERELTFESYVGD